MTRVTDPKAFGRVAVLLGGWSAEREVSMWSGKNVVEAMQRRGIDVTGVEVAEPGILLGLGDKGYDDKMGARPLGRVIQEHIKKPLAEELLFGKLMKGGVVKVVVKGDGIELEIEEPQKPRLTGAKPPLLTAG